MLKYIQSVTQWVEIVVGGKAITGLSDVDEGKTTRQAFYFMGRMNIWNYK
ncbi:hypothetical protein [Clostridium phage Amboise]|nr:hypothetical protein [Clostridium phage Amboise]